MEAIKEREIKLKQKNEEDRANVQDENIFPFDREAAEARVAEINEELVWLQTQVEEREAVMPLPKRFHEIFKKCGVTVTSILLAAGITIGAVVGAITNALKAMGKQIANGLKTLGAKAAAALPGLPFQNCWASHWLSCKAYMALDFGSSCFSCQQIKAALTRCNKYKGNDSNYANNHRGFVHFMMRRFI